MKSKDIAMYVLGALIVGGFFFILYVIFSKVLPTDNREVGLLVIGALVAKFGDVVNWFYGSSRGSSEKNDLLHDKNPNKE